MSRCRFLLVASLLSAPPIAFAAGAAFAGPGIAGIPVTAAWVAIAVAYVIGGFVIWPSSASIRGRRRAATCPQSNAPNERVRSALAYECPPSLLSPEALERRR